MPPRPTNTRNLGILAHVDAGKTSLTERLLHHAGVIDELGSVDAGSTQTDTLALERARGITIKTAVASFALGGTTINLIDTPGHPDFIAEVERTLAVLDGAVLVLSAVEGVQAQSRVLHRALARLDIPTILFVNKVDRTGARPAEVLDDARVAFGVDLPACVGSAITGEGIEELVDAITSRLPAPEHDVDAPLSARVFKIDRGKRGDRVAYVRVVAGSITRRQRLGDHAVTDIRVFADGTTERRDRARAGEIALVTGLADVRIGDVLGEGAAPEHHFAPPTLETIVEPIAPAHRGAMHAALTRLAEQDPLIGLRVDDDGGVHVSLYGEVQKEVIQQTLALDFGVDVTFRETTPICVERFARPISVGRRLGKDGNPYLAGLAFDVRPTAPGSGVRFDGTHDIDVHSVPMYIFKTVAEYDRMLGEYVHDALAARRVTDCHVTITASDYSSPGSKARHFRKLTALLLDDAIAAAGTITCEPIHRFRLDAPTVTLGVLLPALVKLGAETRDTTLSADDRTVVVEGTIAAARVHRMRQALPGLTHGEGVLETAHDSFRPVSGRIET